MSDRIELLTSTERSWARLQALLGRLSDEQLERVGPEGWSVKHHLAHVAAWERWVAALLARRDPTAEVGLTGHEDDDVDAQNAVLKARHGERPLPEVRRLLEESHAWLLEVVDGLSDEELLGPWSAYWPDAPIPDREQRVIALLMAEVYPHLDEHLPWIAALADAGG